MTTDNTLTLNQEATMKALSLILQRAQETTEHNSLIAALKQDRMNCEGEAYSTGQLHARRILSDNPDYSLLCKMVDEAREFTDPDYDNSFPDEDLSISDHGFQMDLMNYPEALQGAMFAGFYAEARRIHGEV